ncbi:MAG: histidine phosphatase family protein [Spirochaetaceae bacterium]|jgi:broad specificity phosphatase PhoE|nr:histidine phosphatase family protein [Spirochaetaceae bacterium]
MQKKIYSNNYYLIRHGHSKANEEGIIISNPEIGTLKYGLTENGKKQIKASAVKFPEIKNPIIYSSDFLRTRESAEILKEILQTEDVLYTPLLRERFFGFYDSLGDDQYNEIWRKDKNDENNKINSVESPKQVFNRVESLINDLESLYTDKNILLVSHGDCLQIMQTVFEQISPALHRSLKHINVAEIRKMRSDASSSEQ